MQATKRPPAILTVTRGGYNLRGWVLFWADVDEHGQQTGIGCGVDGACSEHVFRTMAEAIAYGERRFGEKATRNAYS